MTKPLRVALEERSYSIHFSDHDFDAMIRDLKKITKDTTLFFVTAKPLATLVQNKINQACKNHFKSQWILIPDGEKHKTLKTVESICLALSQKEAHRKSLVVAIGGGVVGDLTGLAASLYRRGIPFVQIPTTLLAQVDSSVGGKTGADLPTGKNLVGHFYQPKAVYVFTSFLKTLTDRDFRSGLAEVVKTALIQDKKFFDFLCQNSKAILKREQKTLAKIVRWSLQIKSKVVSLDETETGLRAILNFGHTFGHAYEVLENYKGLTHGEAVSLGMVFAAWRSAKQKLISENDSKKIVQLLNQFKLPTHTKTYNLKKLETALKQDKKNNAETLKFILLQKIGCAKIESTHTKVLISDWKDFIHESH